MTLPISVPSAPGATGTSGVSADPTATPTGNFETPQQRRRGQRVGVVASLGASIAFAALFGLPSALTGLDPLAAFGWRILAALPFIAVILTILRQWSVLRELLGRMRRQPALVLVLVADALLVGTQMFLFAWGPMHGDALAVSMGYFLLPLVVVAVGVIVLREKLSRMRAIAVLLAAVGVVVAIAAGGSISWATFVVALGYPIYFMLRRRFQLDSPAALALEMTVLAPVSLWFVLRPSALTGLVADPGNVIALVLLGVLTAAGFSAYTIAQSRLSFTAFGLLGYLEPVLLVVVSIVLLGEPLGFADVVTYTAIAAAITALSLDGVPDRLRARRATASPEVSSRAGRLERRRARRRARRRTRTTYSDANAGAPVDRSFPSRVRRFASATSRNR